MMRNVLPAPGVWEITQPPVFFELLSIRDGSSEPAMFFQRNSKAFFWWKRSLDLCSGINAQTLSFSSDKGVSVACGLQNMFSPSSSPGFKVGYSSAASTLLSTV